MSDNDSVNVFIFVVFCSVSLEILFSIEHFNSLSVNIVTQTISFYQQTLRIKRDDLLLILNDLFNECL